MYSTKSFWILIAFMFGILFIKSVSFLDPDFGWHYRNGETIVKSGIPKTDLYSYTMPGYKVVDHSWLSDVLIYLGYISVGQIGLSLFFSFTIILAIFIAIPKSLRQFSILPLLLSTSVFITRAGIRTQMLDWLFLAILIKLRNNRPLVPLIFLIWTNLHGGFVIGFMVLGIHILCEFIKDKKTFFNNSVMFLISILATFITPYGWRMWYESWTILSDTYSRSMIVEWQPFWETVEFGFLFLSTFIFILGWKFKKEIDLFNMILCSCLFLASLTSLRHTPLFLLAGVPLFSYLFKHWYSQAIKITQGKERFEILKKILLIVAIIILTFEIRTATFSFKFPNNAVSFLKQNLPLGNLFSEYRWGGYLDWKLPQKKVFIDGQMPSYRYNVWPFISTPPLGESAWIFKDYTKIAYEGDYYELFTKYNISTVLLQKEDLSPKPSKLITNLKKDGWKEIYSDEVAIVLQKPL